jgi:type IV pilus assembly protein PilP
MKLITLICCSAPLLLVGCLNQADKYSDLDEYMLRMDNQTGPALKEIPQSKDFNPFVYDVLQERSPFDQPKTIEDIIKITRNENIKPDFTRPREVLENFSLDTLHLKGAISRTENGGLTALVSAPDGNIYQVFAGNYLGENHGKIQKVTDQKLDVVEIISDGSGGWREQPTTVELEN